MNKTQPLTDERLAELTAIGIRAVANRNHADLCGCSAWPDNCEHYKPSQWEHGDEEVFLAAVLPHVFAERGAEIQRLHAVPRLITAAEIQNGDVVQDDDGDLWEAKGWLMIPNVATAPLAADHVDRLYGPLLLIERRGGAS